MNIAFLLTAALIGLAFAAGYVLARRMTPSAEKTVQKMSDALKNDLSIESIYGILGGLVFEKPFGFWQCTHAAEWAQRSGFIPGEIYICKKDKSGGYRIYPTADSSWAPYWSDDSKTFCYPPSDMQFTYLGGKLPNPAPSATHVSA